MSPIRAAYFNGEDATRWPVTVLVSAGALVIKYESRLPPDGYESRLPPDGYELQPPPDGYAPRPGPGVPPRPEAVYWPRGTFQATQGAHLSEPLRLERELEALVIDDPVEAARMLGALGMAPRDFSRAAGLIALGLAALAALSYFLALPH